MRNIPFLNLVHQLDDALQDCERILDVGCGKASPLQFLRNKQQKFLVGIDGYQPNIDESNPKRIHQEYKHMDIRNLATNFPDKTFDAVIALDVIEHLDKKEGYELLQHIENIAIKTVIILTPNGFIPQTGRSGNTLEIHKSGWSIKEFIERDYTVKGMYGHKWFRKEEASLRFQPKIVCGIISELSHYLYTKNNPTHSFSLLAIKNLP